MISARLAAAAAPVLPPSRWGGALARLGFGAPVHALLLHAPAGPALALADGTPHAGFEPWCTQHAGARCRLWVAPSAGFDLVAPEGLALADADLPGWARRQFVHFHGDAAAAWPLAVWHAGGGGRGVAAWPAASGAALESLRATAARHGVVLLGVHPALPALHAALRREADAVRRGGVVLFHLEPEGGGPVTMLELSGGGLSAVRRRRLDGATAARADQPLRRDGAWTLATLRDARGGAWAGDFLRPVPGPARAALLVLALAGTLLAGAALDARQAHAERAQALAVVPVASPREPSVRPRDTARPLGASGAPGAPGAGAGTEQAALERRLDHRWDQVFAASERATRAGVTWLSLAHESGSELRLQGLAAHRGAALAAAAALRREAGFERVVLARVEAAAEGGVGERFELVAQAAHPGEAVRGAESRR